MAVRKYSRIEDMPDDALALDAGDPAIPKKIRYLWALAEELLWPVGLCIPRGVRKYRSIDEANADRDRWEQDRVDKLRRHRGEKI